LLDVHCSAALATLQKVPKTVKLGVGQRLVLGESSHGLLGSVSGSVPEPGAWLLSLFQLLDAPIHRPAIPLAIRQQDEEQKHVNQLISGDIPILSQANPNL
jgi:hypothetical protein